MFLATSVSSPDGMFALPASIHQLGRVLAHIIAPKKGRAPFSHVASMTAMQRVPPSARSLPTAGLHCIAATRWQFKTDARQRRWSQRQYSQSRRRRYHTLSPQLALVAFRTRHRWPASTILAARCRVIRNSFPI